MASRTGRGGSPADAGAGSRGRLVPAEDLAHGLARHAEPTGDLAHGDALDQAEPQHLGDVAGRVDRLHRAHSRRRSRRTSRKSPTPTRVRRARTGGVA